jgi:RNA polymerase sigma-70 factor (ECF subfamily)
MAALAGRLPRSCGRTLPEQFHPRYDPSVELERNDSRRALQGALGQLPEKYRAAVQLCYLEGKTNEEAARLLGWPSGTMSRRLQRARWLLRRRLKHSGFIIIFCLAAAAMALLRHDLGSHRSMVSRLSLRQAMHSLGEPSHTEFDLWSRLSQPPGGSAPVWKGEQVAAFARKAKWVAEQAVEHRPKESSEIWLYFAARMRLAALDLDQAAGSGSSPAAMDAGRRLESTCIGCHETFRFSPRLERRTQPSAQLVPAGSSG